MPKIVKLKDLVEMENITNSYDLEMYLNKHIFQFINDIRKMEPDDLIGWFHEFKNRLDHQSRKITTGYVGFLCGDGAIDFQKMLNALRDEMNDRHIPIPK